MSDRNPIYDRVASGNEAIFARSIPEQKMDGTVIPPQSIDVSPSKYGWNKLYHANDMILVSRDEAEHMFDAFVEGQDDRVSDLIEKHHKECAELEDRIISLAKAEESLDRRYTKLRKSIESLCPEGVSMAEHLEAAFQRAEAAEALAEKAIPVNITRLIRKLERYLSIYPDDKELRANIAVLKEFGPKPGYLCDINGPGLDPDVP